MFTETRNINPDEVEVIKEAYLENTFSVSLRGSLGGCRAHANILYTVILVKVHGFLIGGHLWLSLRLS